jgi:hypothetical protein
MPIRATAFRPGTSARSAFPCWQVVDFAATDREDAAPVGIVNDALARRYWAGENSVGKQIAGIEVVGVVRDTNYSALSEGRRPLAPQSPFPSFQKSNCTFTLAKRAVITDVGRSHAPLAMNASL